VGLVVNRECETSGTESTASSESKGLKTGDVGGKSEVRSSPMLRCLRMGRGGREVERSKWSWTGVGLNGSTESGMDGGFGGGVHSTAVCRGPYSHVTSQSLSLSDGER